MDTAKESRGTTSATSAAALATLVKPMKRAKKAVEADAGLLEVRNADLDRCLALSSHRRRLVTRSRAPLVPSMHA